VALVGERQQVHQLEEQSAGQAVLAGGVGLDGLAAAGATLAGLSLFGACMYGAVLTDTDLTNATMPLGLRRVW
jgi:hypothetical protein